MEGGSHTGCTPAGHADMDVWSGPGKPSWRCSGTQPAHTSRCSVGTCWQRVWCMQQQERVLSPNPGPHQPCSMGTMPHRPRLTKSSARYVWNSGRWKPDISVTHSVHRPARRGQGGRGPRGAGLAEGAGTGPAREAARRRPPPRAAGACACSARAGPTCVLLPRQPPAHVRPMEAPSSVVVAR